MYVPSSPKKSLVQDKITAITFERMLPKTNVILKGQSLILEFRYSCNVTWLPINTYNTNSLLD